MRQLVAVNSHSIKLLLLLLVLLPTKSTVSFYDQIRIAQAGQAATAVMKLIGQNNGKYERNQRGEMKKIRTL